MCQKCHFLSQMLTTISFRIASIWDTRNHTMFALVLLMQVKTKYTNKLNTDNYTGISRILTCDSWFLVESRDFVVVEMFTTTFISNLVSVRFVERSEKHWIEWCSYLMQRRSKKKKKQQQILIKHNVKKKYGTHTWPSWQKSISALKLHYCRHGTYIYIYITTITICRFIKISCSTFRISVLCICVVILHNNWTGWICSQLNMDATRDSAYAHTMNIPLSLYIYALLLLLLLNCRMHLCIVRFGIKVDFTCNDNALRILYIYTNTHMYCNIAQITT